MYSLLLAVIYLIFMSLAFDEARAAGVEILYLQCHVEPDSLVIVEGPR
jgi:hypothetical protein